MRFHTNTVLSIHMDLTVDTYLGKRANKTYSREQPVDFNQGDIHEFLGMPFDVSKGGECHVLQGHHVNNIVS